MLITELREDRKKKVGFFEDEKKGDEG